MSVTVDSAKTFKQLQVPSSDLDDGRYAIHTTTEVNKDAFDDKIQYQVWFTTPVRPYHFLLDSGLSSCPIGIG